ncbi:nitroreductase family protein [Desnuesiella massiliensis]|uniref:nitroreductase family protein n=1 Tax=Desnuesiella massiliensis TaxID=1650662 RepID=UPI0006E1EABF|nr:nitroreductase family protein [Desnuesiella massiliensis]
MLEILKKRRSIRKYTSKKVEKEKVIQLIQGALLSPTSKNSKPWEFIVVEDKSLLEKLSLSKLGAQFLKNADLGIVILGNPALSSVWIEDASIATTVIHLMSEELQLGSCWIQIRERSHDDNTSAEEYVRKVLNIPENLGVLAIVSIGYADEVKEPKNAKDLNYEKVYLNTYSKKYPFEESK